MGDAEIKTSQWKLVEAGRVVLTAEGKLGAIVEIIDHKRVMIDGAGAEAGLGVSRQAAPLSGLALTPIVIPNLPRGARTSTVRTAWTGNSIDTKWKESNWAKKRLQAQRRKALTDFERFKVMRLKKQARFEVRKSLAKVKAA